MARLLPVGLLTMHEAATKIEDAMFAGIPDREAVVSARKQYGADVGDRDAHREAIAELWKAVDAERVRPLATGGLRRRVMKLDPDQTRAIPALRVTGDFTMLRPRNAEYAEITRWFGVGQIANVTLAFRERDIEKLCSKLRQARRRRGRSPQRRAAGRPSVQTLIRPCIFELVDQGKWNTSQSIKALTLLVNRKLKRDVSEDSVGRAIDGWYIETTDRRFLRHRRSRQH